MKTTFPLQKNQRQTYQILKSCLFLTLFFNGIFAVQAQKAHFPLSVFSKDYKPNNSNLSTVKNSSPSVHPTGTGTWIPLANLAPHNNNGGMLLLSDGTVLV